ncbi:GLPGLI family protein [Dysgonomonas sp. PFB1-18]|uniref:GLPGLI family protein n=1 Tax=unclassified Dysgonomonas TaxID=2630389 RepID=UPI0024737E01|nr:MULTISPECIES: GLPGLI family protein [unclassified Dysgonomonas]MDH6307602.1 GLPGLI family protein [Dysgonomonas sp. PF1-14]MDH6337520.1 GLPGLI family protein [Dysgonomonas sp. PF1-16]MDH6378745.1 GLPGLI family protein [Dysgonomonas sp. PFB1-18]MDH6399163.1 GLPGLI family protein [Dysgonomonas sp. PF1-23]
MKQLILLSTFLLSTVFVCSQSVVTNNNVQIRSMKKEVVQDSLDNATIRCYYKLVQPVTIDKEVFQQTDTMTLDIGKQISVYYDANRMRRDSLFGDFMKNGLSAGAIRNISVVKDGDMSAIGNQGTTVESGVKGETARLYKKRSLGEIIIIDKAENSISKYKYTGNESQQWNITTDTLTVLGYLCQKATTSFHGRNYEVWFSPDIPVSDGPWKFYGLPGLILKAEDSEKLFSFEIVGLEQLNTPKKIFMERDDYIKASRKDLAKLKRQQSGGMAVNINAGNVVMVQKKNKNEYLQLETE